MILCYIKKHKEGAVSLKKSIITFASITHALKARRQLSRVSIGATLVKLDSDEEATGCRYGLEIYTADLYSAIALLRGAGLEYKVRDANDIPG